MDRFGLNPAPADVWGSASRPRDSESAARVDTPQFAGEQPFLPDETRAISGSVTPISADKVATAILRGIDRRRANIFTDPTTTILDRLVRVAPGITQRWLDSKVAGVAKDR